MPVVLVKVTVVALTVLLKVVPPELVMVSVPTLVPTAPLTVIDPVVSKVKLALPLDGPVMVVRLIGVAAPAPKVRLLLSAIAPKVIVPVEVPPIVDVPPIVTPVLLSPKVITPVPAAVTVPLTVMALGAVAVKPPVKANVPPLVPKVTVPVLIIDTALVMVPLLAFRAKL